MNAKLCKKLRRAAERATVGKPARAWTWERVATKRANYFPRRIINHPQSTRGAYRHLKKAVQRAGRAPQPSA